MPTTFHKLASMSQVKLNTTTVKEEHVNVNGLKRYLVRMPSGSLPLVPGVSFPTFIGTPHRWGSGAITLPVPRGKSVREIDSGQLELWVSCNP